MGSPHPGLQDHFTQRKRQDLAPHWLTVLAVTHALSLLKFRFETNESPSYPWNGISPRTCIQVGVPEGRG